MSDVEFVDWSAEAGPKAEERPPVTSRPSSTTTRPARGWRLCVDKNFTRPLFPEMLTVLLQEIDRGEQSDPHDVDEVPVVRDDDRGHGLLVSEVLGQERPAEHEEERDQPA